MFPFTGVPEGHFPCLHWSGGGTVWISHLAVHLKTPQQTAFMRKLSIRDLNPALIRKPSLLSS